MNLPWRRRWEAAETEADAAVSALVAAERERDEARQLAEHARQLHRENGFMRAVYKAFGVQP